MRVELRGELKGRSAYLDGLGAVRQLDALGVDRAAADHQHREQPDLDRFHLDSFAFYVLLERVE